VAPGLRRGNYNNSPELVESYSRGEVRIEETSRALWRSRRRITELDLVELSRERLVAVKVGLAMNVPFIGAGYPWGEAWRQGE
jgi:hypothetical protein